MIKKTTFFFVPALRKEIESNPELGRSPAIQRAVQLHSDVVQRCLFGPMVFQLSHLEKGLGSVLTGGHSGFNDLCSAFGQATRMESHIRQHPADPNNLALDIRFYQKGFRAPFREVSFIVYADGKATFSRSIQNPSNERSNSGE